ncbi:MAG: HEPN domain-containing protein [Bacillota bacterium]
MKRTAEFRRVEEAAELALTGVLRQIGVDPAKLHDVGGLLLEYGDKLPPEVARRAERLAG